MAQLSVAEFDTRFAQLRPRLEVYARLRVSREDSEDLVSECFTRARHSLAAYQSERDLLAWLRGILENLLRLHFRQLRIRREVDCEGEDASVEREAKGEREAARTIALRRGLYRRIAAVDLTARQYECLVRTLEGDTQQQIAARMGISQRMVSYHLQAAQTHLRDVRESRQELDRYEFFYECAHHPIYRKPDSFDNRSNSVDREQHRYACLKEQRGDGREKREKVTL